MTDRFGRVLAVMAHPDDAEFGAGGTIGKLVKQGADVTYLVVTNGSMGSSDRTMTRERLARIREAEQRDAARTLGRDITRQIRRWRPDLVIAQNPHHTYSLHGSHRDHRVVGGVVLDCVYPLARDHLAFPEILAEYEPHKVCEVYVIRWQWEDHQLAVDISETIDLKLAA